MADLWSQSSTVKHQLSDPTDQQSLKKRSDEKKLDEKRVNYLHHTY